MDFAVSVRSSIMTIICVEDILLSVSDIGSQELESVADFDWDSHMAVLKKLVSSPGITLYSGRRMFPARGDNQQFSQQPHLSPHGDGTVMEFVCYIYYFNADLWVAE
jgi:hypothetical protein